MTSKPDYDAAREVPICIIGAGPAGLITAHTLLRDGFKNVQVLTHDKTIGGVWARERIYPAMTISNIHGEWYFSSLPMRPPSNADSTGGRLRGIDICEYLEEFYEKLILQHPVSRNSPTGSIVRFNTKVLNVTRGAEGQGWNIFVEDIVSKERETLFFPRLVLCSGQCSVPVFGKNLRPEDAVREEFKGPVIHTAESWGKRDVLLKYKKVVVFGGGKSAQDVSAFLAAWGVPVTTVYEAKENNNAVVKVRSPRIRKSRIVSTFTPSIDLETSLETFVHKTSIGVTVARAIWSRLAAETFRAYDIPEGSPLRLTYDIFWDCRIGDEGLRGDHSFLSLAQRGEIEIIAPARVIGFYHEGVVLDTGKRVPASAVVCATGSGSSWREIMSDELALEIGLINVIKPEDLDKFKWDYVSLHDPPNPAKGFSSDPITAPGVYKGILPARSLDRRDIAYAANLTYTYEANANWISAYFLGEPLRLPKSIPDAVESTVREVAWIKGRFPTNMIWAVPGQASLLPFFSWPQFVDGLLDDMHLPTMRSGGNWFSWVYQEISIEELKTLGEERRQKRGEV